MFLRVRRDQSSIINTFNNRNNRIKTTDCSININVNMKSWALTPAPVSPCPCLWCHDDVTRLWHSRHQSRHHRLLSYCERWGGGASLLALAGVSAGKSADVNTRSFFFSFFFVRFYIRSVTQSSFFKLSNPTAFISVEDLWSTRTGWWPPLTAMSGQSNTQHTTPLFVSKWFLLKMVRSLIRRY